MLETDDDSKVHVEQTKTKHVKPGLVPYTCSSRSESITGGIKEVIKITPETNDI